MNIFFRVAKPPARRETGGKWFQTYFDSILLIQKKPRRKPLSKDLKKKTRCSVFFFVHKTAADDVQTDASVCLRTLFINEFIYIWIEVFQEKLLFHIEHVRSETNLVKSTFRRFKNERSFENKHFIVHFIVGMKTRKEERKKKTYR